MIANSMALLATDQPLKTILILESDIASDQ